MSTLLVAAAVTKISLLPLTSILWGCYLLRTQLWQKGTSESSAIFAAAIVPWVIFYLPLPAWTWIHSGSPFGPIMAGKFGDSVYSVDAIHAVLSGSQRTNRQFNGLLPLAGYPYSILFWLLLVGFGCIRTMPRLIPMLALAIQTALICTVLPYDLRFLGGTQLAAVILAAMYLPQKWSEGLTSHKLTRAAILVGLLPWFCLQLYYVAPFVSSVVGLTTQADFNERYIAFYRDFRELDKRLPRDAAILTTGVRPPSFYFPREVYVRQQDVAGDRPVYLFACNTSPNRLARRIPQLYELGGLIYENKDTLISASRVPGVPSKRGALQVFRLGRISDH